MVFLQILPHTGSIMHSANESWMAKNYETLNIDNNQPTNQPTNQNQKAMSVLSIKYPLYMYMFRWSARNMFIEHRLQ